jgi:PAS domain S-box-containing protein
MPESAFSEVQQKYEALFNLAADGIVVHELMSETAGGHFIQANPAICSLLGHTHAEMLELTPLDIMAPEDRQAVDRDVNTMAAAGVLRHEKTLVAKDGRRIPVEISTQLFPYQGRPLVMSVIRDVTERKRAEETLRESEQQLRHARELLEAVTTGTKVLIATVDRDFRYTFFNREHHEELKRITGKDTAIGMSLTEVLADMPEERDRALAIWGRALNGETITQTLRFGSRGGQSRWYNTNHAPLHNAAGQIVGAGEVTSEITDLVQAQASMRESEERYRTLFDRMTEGFALHEIVTDEQGRPVDYRFLDVNPAFERQTGLQRADLIGSRVMEVLPGTETSWIEKYGRVALTGEPVHFEEYSSVLNRWYEVYAYRPAFRQFAVVFADITKRKLAEEELLARNAELTEFNCLMVDRELRMVELKREINELCRQADQPPRYDVSEEAV